MYAARQRLLMTYGQHILLPFHFNLRTEYPVLFGETFDHTAKVYEEVASACNREHVVPL